VTLRPRVLAILSCAGMAYALGQTMLIPALGVLKEDLGTDTSGVAWLLTGYLVAAAIFTPVFGRLGDMFGKRRMLVLSLAIFASGCSVSARGSSLEVVVAGRVLQGVGGGIFPLAFGLIRDEFPPERVGPSIGLLSATLGIGGGAGLIIGGLIVDHASYHWIFWMGAILAAAAGLAIAAFVPESPHRHPGRVDVRGAVVLGAGLTLPLVAIARANAWGWTSAQTFGLLLAGALILGGWVVLQRRTPEPMVDVRMLGRRPVLLTNAATLLVGLGMFGSYLLIPQLLEAPESTGYGSAATATTAGLIMLPGSLVILFFGPVSGRLGARVGNKVPLALGASITGTGLILLAFMYESVLAVLLLNVVISIGVGLAYSAMPNLIVDHVPRHQTGESTGFNAVVRSIGSSLGAQISAAILAGSVVAETGFPSGDGYAWAFVVNGVVALAALGVALLIPGDSRGHLSVAAEIGAASPLPDPALAAEG
jgi:EmrB/QacA subfamily drug resistance transporter